MPTWKIYLPHILYVASPYETARRLLYPGVVRAPSCSALPRIYIYTYPLSSFGSFLLAGPAVASVPAAAGRAATEAAGECGCCLSSTCQLVVLRRNFLFLGKGGYPGPSISTQLQHSTSQYYIHIHPARKDRRWTWTGGCRTDWRTGVWVSGRTDGRADNGWPGEWVAIGNSSTSSSSLFCSCMDGGGECDGRVDAAPAEDVPVPHGQPAIHPESDGGPCHGSQLRMAGRRPHRGGSPQRAPASGASKEGQTDKTRQANTGACAIASRLSFSSGHQLAWYARLADWVLALGSAHWRVVRAKCTRRAEVQEVKSTACTKYSGAPHPSAWDSCGWSAA